MFEINVDSNGYYAEGNDGELVEVEEIPSVEDVRYLPAYKYAEETKQFVLNKDKLLEIKQDIEDNTPTALPTIEERLEAIEGLMLDMLNGDAGING